MKKTIQLLDKPLILNINTIAERLLQYREQPLLVEMELYFSCLIRKQVHFRTSMDCDIQATIDDQLIIGFRPVMTRVCRVNACNNLPPPVTDFPVVRAERYIPDWLTLDYNGEQWFGKFGYH